MVKAVGSRFRSLSLPSREKERPSGPVESPRMCRVRAWGRTAPERRSFPQFEWYRGFVIQTRLKDFL